MLALSTEKKLLQMAVTIACVVPLSAGLFGACMGAKLLGSGTMAMDSHFRYLSGLLLAIGIGFLSTVANIENHTKRFRLLTLIVVTGGIARLLGFFLKGLPDIGMQAALIMELVITPALCLWQYSLSKRIISKRTSNN